MIVVNDGNRLGLLSIPLLMMIKMNNQAIIKAKPTQNKNKPAEDINKILWIVVSVQQRAIIIIGGDSDCRGLT